MDITISLDYKDALLELSENGRGIDSVSFSYYHDLDDKLITVLDKLLKKNNIDVRALGGYKIQGNLGENATSVKIAQAVIEGLKI